MEAYGFTEVPVAYWGKPDAAGTNALSEGEPAQAIAKSLSIERFFRNEGRSFSIAEISAAQGEELAPLVSEGETGDNAVPDRSGQAWLESARCRCLLLFWEAHEEVRVLFLSDTKRIRALEFLDALLSEYGMAKGNASAAYGFLSATILSAVEADREIDGNMEFFLKMTAEYFEDTDCIEAAEYAGAYGEQILAWPRYQKARASWAYVKSTDAAGPGRQIRIKMLENESGLTVTAREDLYIMIGIRGEVYCIEEGTFQKTYVPSGEALDVFERMMDFLPEAEALPDGAYISLDEIAHLCYPKAGGGIYARPIERRTKVFPKGSEDYFLGRPGDYLAIRADNLEDIYIISRDIFHESYEAA